VTVEQALAHPTWEMGGKITIDSATLMNKGLELIEAHHLFGVPYERSTCRASAVDRPRLVSLCDGAMLAHLGCPDMRVPIAYALHYPSASSCRWRARPAAVASLTFEPPDLDAFPCLRLARSAAGPAGDPPAC
jgi:1-deoxy-D-xylulose-5-phosphate reductoisomerase